MKSAQEILTSTFNSREEYIAWRIEWRAVYATISEDIRTVRLVRKDNCRNPVVSWDSPKQSWQRVRAWTTDEAARQERVKLAYERSREAYGHGHKGLSDLATALLVRRAWSKEESQRQYLAAKATAAA